MPILKENESRYPKDWEKRSRFVRFYRAKGKCEWCGAQHGEPHHLGKFKVRLAAAHVWDKNPENSSLLNLAALCQRCHVMYDGKWDKKVNELKKHGQMMLPGAFSDPPKMKWQIKLDKRIAWKIMKRRGHTKHRIQHKSRPRIRRNAVEYIQLKLWENDDLYKVQST